jgi:undecaprenyl-diphosphatase
LHDYILAAVLGIVEGLTEFLPVSSTAHLRISEALLGIDLGNGYWKMFSIVIQLGAILCLPIYFRKRIAEFLSTFPKGKSGDKSILTHPVSLTIIAFVCTAIPAFLLTKVIGKHLESLSIMGGSLVIGGIIMWVVDALYDRGVLAAPGRRTDDMDQMSLGQAVWIGLCQITSAVFPGTSRSMSTIAAGQIANMSRSAALEFSFFLSIPTMVVATCYEAFKTMLPHKGVPPIGAGPANAQQWIALAIGFLVSFVVAYVVVAWFMRWVRQHGFIPFAIWRLAVGAFVLLWMVRPH